MTTQNINNSLPNRGVSGESSPVANVGKSKTAPADQTKVVIKDAPTSDQLQRMVAKANTAMDKVSSNLEFSVDDSTNKTVIRVMESQSGKLIMQFPSEEMLSVTRAIDHAQKGALLKDKA